MKQLEKLIVPLMIVFVVSKIAATMDGIGYYTALTIVSELGDVSRFPNSDRVVSYCGLNPRVHQSSTMLRSSDAV